MSLGMMMYKQQRYTQRSGGHFGDPKQNSPATEADRIDQPAADSSAAITLPRSARTESDRTHTASDETSDDFWAGGYVIARPRSVALPLMAVITLIALVISFFHPGTASASNSFPALCQLDGATIKAHNDETWRIVNDTGSVQRVVCPIMAVPGGIDSANLVVEQPAVVVAPTTCALLSRPASGGQASGERKTVTVQGRAALKLAISRPGADFYHYVECDLAPGATLSELTTVHADPAASAAQHPVPAKTKTNQDWVLLAEDSENNRPGRSTRKSLLEN